jgi:hypothetical protein
MPKYSVIFNNKVVNSIVAESKEDAELLTKLTCVEQNESFPYGINYIFDGTNWYFPGENLETKGEQDA